MAAQSFPQVSGMSVVITTALMFVVNAIVLMAANALFPDHVVLGTHALSYYWAIYMSMGKLALITAFVLPFVSRYELSRQKLFSPMEWMGLYFVINFVSLWAISRFSEQFGLGVSSWMVVLALTVVLDVVQGMTMTLYGNMLKK